MQRILGDEAKNRRSRTIAQSFPEADGLGARTFPTIAHAGESNPKRSERRFAGPDSALPFLGYPVRSALSRQITLRCDPPSGRSRHGRVRRGGLCRSDCTVTFGVDSRIEIGIARNVSTA